MGKSLASRQIEFVNLIVNHLTENGVMDAPMIYESQFTDIVPKGPDDLFDPVELDQLMAALDRVKPKARAA